MRSDPNLLRRASDDDKPLAARLIQLYLYDLAAVVDFPIGADGLYDYEFLEAFWHTPYLLQRIYELTEGRSLDANVALVLHNAALGARIAAELVKLPRE